MEQLPHYAIIQGIVQEASNDADVIGILLAGSLARGDALPGSDIDLHFLLTTMEHQTTFRTEIRDGILVERGYEDYARAQFKLENNPMEVYTYVDGRILFDPTGALARLAEAARTRFANYVTPEGEKKKIGYWLKRTRMKTAAALAAGDPLKAAYVSSTASWTILTGLWAANDRPLPPNGAVWAHLKDLSRGPADIEMRLQQLFLADTERRARTAIDLIDWMMPLLDQNNAENGATESVL